MKGIIFQTKAGYSLASSVSECLQDHWQTTSVYSTSNTTQKVDGLSVSMVSGSQVRLFLKAERYSVDIADLASAVRFLLDRTSLHLPRTGTLCYPRYTGSTGTNTWRSHLPPSLLLTTASLPSPLPSPGSAPSPSRFPLGYTARKCQEISPWPGCESS